MPRLSNYRPLKTNDYRFFDRTIREMYQVGGVDVFVHKYMGPLTNDNGDGNPDATMPSYPTSDPLFIEDLLLLENRDRKYDPDIFIMRMVYQEADIDFDLTQFGLFLNGDTKFLTLHYNDMIQIFGRKLMSGDVLEFPNLRDYNPLDKSIMKALPRYYVVQDAAWAAEGFSQTWLPHLWRLKCTPLVNSQEYYDIMNKPFEPNNIWDPGNYYPPGMIVQDGDKYYQAGPNGVPPGTAIGDPNYWTPITDPTTIGDVDSTRDKDLQINDAILTQAMVNVPASGFDNVNFYILPTHADGSPAYATNTSNFAVNTASVLAVIDGLKQVAALQYNISQDPTTKEYSMTLVNTPSTGAVMQTRYLNMTNPDDIASQTITPNGVVRTFELDYATTAEAILVSVGGLILKPNIDYQVTDTQLTFRGIPSTSNFIEILFLSISDPEHIQSQVIVNPVGAQGYQLTQQVESAADILVFFNGRLQIPEINYTASYTSLFFKVQPSPKINIEVRFIVNLTVNPAPITNQQIIITAGQTVYPVNDVSNAVTPTGFGYTMGYMTGTQTAPNGLPVTPGIAFPLNPSIGDYCLRLDYYPNRLFRFNGSAWIKIEEDIRTGMYLKEGDNTQRSSFVNNTYTVRTNDQGNIPSRQSLSQVLRPVADNGNQGGNLAPNPWPGTQPGQQIFPNQP